MLLEITWLFVCVPVEMKYTTQFPAASAWHMSLFLLRSYDHFISAFLSTAAALCSNYHKTVYLKRHVYVFAFATSPSLFKVAY